MEERRKEGEQKFWDGHSFKDNCEWTQEQSIGFTNSVHEFVSDNQRHFLEESNYYTLRDAVKKGKSTTIKRFRKGEVFDAKEFPLGTVVRLLEDYQHNDTILNWRAKVQNIDLYGLVAQQIIAGQSYDILVCFKAHQIQKSDMPHAANGILNGKIEVGKVEHCRINTDYLVSAIKIKQYEFLKRVNSLEVLQSGTGVRKIQPDAREKPVFPPGVLSPKRVFS